MISTPSPPDPKETAAAQAGMNRDTAMTQQQLNMVDQNNPWGSVKYDQTGMTGFVDSQGNWVETPTYSQTTTFSPQQQAIFDQTQQAQGNLAGLAVDQSGKMRDLLNTPFEFDNQDAENWAYDLGATRLDPRFEQERKALETQLVNRGIRPGTPAYDAEMSRFGQTKNDAYNQLMLQGRSQAFDEAMRTRAQPINELTALLSGSQVSNPGAQSPNAPQTGVGGVNYTGLVSDNYKAESAASADAMGGLFGLLSAPFQMFKFSDRRLKSDVRRVGALYNGLPVYAYRYVTGGPVQIGLMADEVAEIVPTAVTMHPSGFAMVDYGRAVDGHH